MQFKVHKIQTPVLKPFVQYILFNQCGANALAGAITSFANTNVCLGVLKGFTLTEAAGGGKWLRPGGAITSYVTGLYCKPHRVITPSVFDEICIDFTPLGLLPLFSFFF